MWYSKCLIYVFLQYETTDKHLSPDGQYVPRIIFVGELIQPHQINNVTQRKNKHINDANLPRFPDPSMTVRADITGRYSNRMYAYEPADMKLCKFERSMKY